ncbi:MAG: D-glycero-beta-D-manno-heptose 1-phosphate adenylyltransferase [Bdellovibrionales bacterium]|nr:D-glycero-beta-D-manno-heptose 1-phosphate adenylyltransferase [Bdellovibrionales bacterium]
MGHVLTLEQWQVKAKDIRKNRKHLVFTNGCFDILHVGHVRYLQQARQLGDLLMVGLNSDSSVKKLKGESRPVQCEEDRAEILSALQCVDFVILFDEETPLSLIQQIQPDILVKGGDWSVEKIVGSNFVLSRGGQVQSLPFHPGRSTSLILKKVLAG